jgi:uncharacterized membrane protein (UPF0136 family)
MSGADEQFFSMLVKPLLIGVASGALFAVINQRLRGAERLRPIDAVVIVPIALIAYIAGYLTGSSGSPAIGNLIPAVLTFIGGLNVYLFGAKHEYRALSLFGIFLFAIVLFYGALDGGYARVAQCEDYVTLSEHEREINVLRQNFDLPTLPATWSTVCP